LQEAANMKCLNCSVDAINAIAATREEAEKAMSQMDSVSRKRGG